MLIGERAVVRGRLVEFVKVLDEDLRPVEECLKLGVERTVGDRVVDLLHVVGFKESAVDGSRTALANIEVLVVLEALVELEREIILRDNDEGVGAPCP